MWAATPCPQAATACVQARVRFATEGELPDANGTLATGVETTPVRLSAGEIVVIAPSMSLEQGDVRTGRGDPCWNPPCRRTVLSVAINGIDFVEGAVPIEYALPTSAVTTDYWPLTTYCVRPIAHPTYNSYDSHDSEYSPLTRALPTTYHVLLTTGTISSSTRCATSTCSSSSSESTRARCRHDSLPAA